MAKQMVQVGVMSFRDPATGDFLKPSIPIYAEKMADVEELTTAEEKTITDVAGIFAAKFKQYADGVKALNKSGVR